MPAPYRDVSEMSMGEINRELGELSGSDPATLERQAELFDALLSGDMGGGPARRAMCERRRLDEPEAQEGREA